MPQRWQDRQRSFGTDELVELLVRCARKVNRGHHGAVLGVADLSPRGGGSTAEHRSHRSGRDVDLLYYSVDARNKPIVPTEMITFDRRGLVAQPKSQPVPVPAPPGRRPQPGAAPSGSTSGAAAESSDEATGQKLDLPRTWAMVRVLITDPHVPVQWIFIGRPIAQLLVDHARKRREPEYLIERAIAVMHQPSDAQTHMDHWHLRVFCSTSDRFHGCKDRGPARWLKKDLKYVDSSPEPDPPLDLAFLTLRPLGVLGN